MPWSREQLAERAARELRDGFYVNLGIAHPGLDDRQVRGQPGLEQIRFAVDHAGLLAFGRRGPRAGASVEAVDSRTAGADPLGQRALRIELDFQLAV